MRKLFATLTARAGDLFWAVLLRAGFFLSVASKTREIKQLKIMFFPAKIRPTPFFSRQGYAIEKIFYCAGMKPVGFSVWDEPDIIFDWQDFTRNPLDAKDLSKAVSEDQKKGGRRVVPMVINHRCCDITKSRVSEANARVFGKALSIRSAHYKGKAVVKSERNGAHDGEIIECPTEVEMSGSGKIVCRLINNVASGSAIDYRVIYIGRVIELVYEKQRPVEERFSNFNDSVILRRSSDIFSEKELNQIEQFAEEIGIDYGELDILRDQETSEIFIVDVAKTPAGPPNGLKGAGRARALKVMTKEFVSFLDQFNRAKI